MAAAVQVKYEQFCMWFIWMPHIIVDCTRNLNVLFI